MNSNNLNLCRMVLALMVTWSHAYPLTAHVEPVSRLWPSETGGSLAVKAFFFISGMLIMQSASRSTWHSFLIARFFRLWPALVAALILSVALAGISSSVDDQIWWLAAGNYLEKNLYLIFGVIYELPGAYENNPMTSVNGSLWTLPWEVRMYAICLLACLFAVQGSRKKANIFLGFFVLVWILGSTRYLGFRYDNPEARIIVACFLLGALVAVNSKQADYRRISLGFLVIGGLLLVLNLPSYCSVMLVSAVVLFLGFPQGSPVYVQKTDISYGIYVYSFPIQQFAIFMLGDIGPAQLLYLVLPIILIASYISWRFIEKPAIELGKKLRVSQK